MREHKFGTFKIIAIVCVVGLILLSMSSIFNKPNYGDGNVVTDGETINEITIRINDKSYIVRMDVNDAAQEFARSTPFELPMVELNGNEKYYRGADTLVTDAHRMTSVKTGDLMLYEDNCIVLFYKDFETDYSYTRLGWVYDAEDLAETLGDGNVNVIFTKN
jgi:hypothetical protein